MKDQEMNNKETREQNTAHAQEQSQNIDPKRNDTAGADDDTLGENTEMTPLAQELLKDKDAGADAKRNQENKDFSEKNG